MQLKSSENQKLEISEAVLNPGQDLVDTDDTIVEVSNTTEPMCFQTHFEDHMEMYADLDTVAKYLDTHQGWFSRCAKPMTADPLGDNGYALVIGRFGAFGYEVEPKIGLQLLPPEEGIYRIRTIPVPNYVPPGYDVDYRAAMNLVAGSPEELAESNLSALTRVEWQLDLAVYIQFPKFIHKLSKSLIQNTGDRLLSQIVRQVSRRLTYKVQEDFHTNLGLPIPKKSKKRAA